jgi:hypothetical protein
MATEVLRYSLDPTGVNPDNLVSGEVKTMPNRKIRAVAPQYGAFFSKSLVVTDVATGKALTADQYYAAEMYEQPTLEYGQEICSIVMIVDPTVSSQVSLQYQALGGEYSSSQDAIINQLYNLSLDDRPVSWPNVVGKPDAFPPSPHLHDAGDLYGFEYVVQAIDRLRAAVLLGDTASHDAILRYVDAAIASIQTQIDSGNVALQQHVQDHGNPHQVSAAQVGAYTKAQSDANDATVASNAATATNQVKSSLNTHLADTNNPHKVSAAQLNVYTIPQIDSMMSSSNATITNHINNQSNPHKVTAAQVGAYTTSQSDTNLNNTANAIYTYVNQQLAIRDNNINGKAPNYGDYAYTGRGQGVSFGGVTTGDLVATGTIYSYNDIWAFWSDKRLKRNIRQIDNPLRKLKRICGVTYEHNELAKKLIPGTDLAKRHMGLLAQQVQGVAPEVVGLAAFDRDPETGLSKSGENYITIKYDKLVALVVEAVKQVDGRVDGVVRALKRSGLGLTGLPVIEDVTYEEMADASVQALTHEPAFA